jgi:hypothetical protein
MYGFLFFLFFSFLSSTNTIGYNVYTYIYSSISIYPFRSISFYLFRIPSLVETETNHQLLLKLKKPENGELLKNTSMSTEYLINEQQNCSTTNGHDDSLCKPLTIQSPASSADQTAETFVQIYKIRFFFISFLLVIQKNY